MKKILVYKSQEEMINSAADLFISTGSAAIRDRGQFSVALSGGSTPIPLYENLADQKTDELDWNKVHFFWGDERCVPPDHPDSNFDQVNRSLLLPGAIPEENIHRIRAELPPAEAAWKYQEEILSWFQQKNPSFDLILLGMGNDGHTASLFPETELVKEELVDQNRLVEANWVPKLDAWRITFTPRLINAAQNILFLVSGQNKARILKLVLEGPALPEQYPSQLIDPDQGNLFWYIDQEASAELSNVRPV
jgi:6-phosphogluconolactonase